MPPPSPSIPESHSLLTTTALLQSQARPREGKSSDGAVYLTRDESTAGLRYGSADPGKGSGRVRQHHALPLHPREEGPSLPNSDARKQRCGREVRMACHGSLQNIKER